MQKLDDRVNPIVIKELRQAVNGRFLAAVLILFLLISLLVLAVAMMGSDRQSTELGRNVMLSLNMILVGTCLLFLPAYAGFRFAAERNDNNTDLMFITTIPPRAIVWGKLLSTILLGVLIYSACLPFLTLTYLMRGIDLPTIFLILGMGFLIICCGVMLALFAATTSTSRAFRVLLGLGVASALFLMFMFVGEISWEWTRWGIGSAFEEPAFWGAIASVLLAFGSYMALMYSFSVALISPPSANRAMPVRITMVGVWLLSGIATALWATQEPEIIWIWLIFCGIGWGAAMLIAACERDEWGPRVARTIPRNPLGRIVALLFYSGSVGGLLFAWVMLLSSIGAAWIMQELFARPGRFYNDWNFGSAAEIALALGFYGYAYAMAGVVLQRAALRKVLPREHTWALSIAVCALACTLPPLLAFIVMQDNLHQSERIWMTPAPYSVFFDDMAGQMRRNALLFSGAFAAVMALITVPWMTGVLGRFRYRSEGPTDGLETLEERLGEDARVAARVWVFFAAVCLLGAIFLLIAPFATGGEQTAMRIAGGFMLLIAVGLIALARGLNRRQKAAWHTSRVLCLPLCLSFPIGTLLAMLIWYKLGRAKPLFEQGDVEPQPEPTPAASSPLTAVEPSSPNHD